MICRFADFNFDIQLRQKYLEMFADYKTDDTVCDMAVEVTRADAEYEVEKSQIGRKLGYLEFIATYRKIAEWLPAHDALVMHGTLFDVEGTGVLFTALSGTGKTTHMLLWQKLLGKQLTIVNGDKPIMRFLPDGLFGYGTPWNGKEQLGCNMRTPLKHICFIERSPENYVESISKSEAIARVMQQVYMPKDPAAVAATFSLVDRILDRCKLWIIHCNMEPQAAEVAYNEIIGKGITDNEAEI